MLGLACTATVLHMRVELRLELLHAYTARVGRCDCRCIRKSKHAAAELQAMLLLLQAVFTLTTPPSSKEPW